MSGHDPTHRRKGQCHMCVWWGGGHDPHTQEEGTVSRVWWGGGHGPTHRRKGQYHVCGGEGDMAPHTGGASTVS